MGWCVRQGGLALLLALGTWTWSGPAQAAPLSNDFGLASPDVALDFGELTFAADTLVTNEYAGFGVVFTNLAYSPSCCPGAFPGISGARLGDILPGGGVIGSPISIAFAEVQTEAAFAVASNDGLSTFTALLNGTPVESFALNVLPGANPAYVGFTGVSFDEIQISGSPGLLLDNLQFGSSFGANVFQNDFGLPAPDQRLGFHEVLLPSETILTTQYQAFGVEFENVVRDPACCPQDFVAISGARAGDISPLVSGPVHVRFSTPLLAAAFGVASNNGESTFTALLAGVPVRSFTFNALVGTHGGYVGFADVVFDELRIDNSPGLLIDDLQSVFVPNLDDVLAFYDAAVASGEIVERRKNGVKILRNKIAGANALIAAAMIPEACSEIDSAIEKADGLRRPRDWVTGPAVPQLESMLADVAHDLGCP